MKKHKLDNKTDSQFHMFDRAGKKAWLETVTKDLGETDFEKALVWKTDDGFDVQPMYFAEDTENIEHKDFAPGMPPFVRGTSILENKKQAWTISQVISCPEVKLANKKLIEALARGHAGTQLVIDFSTDSKSNTSASIQITSASKQNAPASIQDDADSTSPENSGIRIGSEKDLSMLLDGVDITGCELTIDAGNETPAFLEMFKAVVVKRAVKGGDVNAAFSFDPLSRLALDGRLPWSEQETFDRCGQTVKFTREHFPAARCLSVDGQVFHNSGASGSDEVALALSAGLEYVRRLLDRDVDVHDAAVALRFTFAAGTNFFPEIAKLRAARMLWAKIMHHVCSVDQTTRDIDPSCLKMDMHVSASKWHQTVLDPYVNMLRGTIESMSAAIGGARTITTLPFDSASASSERFSDRAAGNTQIILQDEAYLTEVVDPSSGSHYIETLTENLAKKVWRRFQEIEKNGGYLASLKNGAIQQLLEEAANKKQQRVEDLSEVLVGTNKYQNPAELPEQKGDIQQGRTTSAYGKDSSRTSSIPDQGGFRVQAIPQMRLAEKIECKQGIGGNEKEGKNV